jgi:hypothetical protein
LGAQARVFWRNENHGLSRRDGVAKSRGNIILHPLLNQLVIALNNLSPKSNKVNRMSILIFIDSMDDVVGGFIESIVNFSGNRHFSLTSPTKSVSYWRNLNVIRILCTRNLYVMYFFGYPEIEQRIA